MQQRKDLAVFCASHIDTDIRIELLEASLKSLLKNTIRPTFIYLSISFESTLESFFERKKFVTNAIVNMWSKFVKGSNDCPSYHGLIWEVHPARLYQFEHFVHLYQTWCNKDTVHDILFVDDDDLYSSKIIEEMQKFLTCYEAVLPTGISFGIDNDTREWGEIEEMCEKQPYTTRYDFSGLAVRIELIHSYFSTHKIRCGGMEDHRFRKFIAGIDDLSNIEDSKINCLFAKLAYYRNWDNPKSWKI